jgi:hypothetical protein
MQAGTKTKPCGCVAGARTGCRAGSTGRDREQTRRGRVTPPELVRSHLRIGQAVLDGLPCDRQPVVAP